METKKVVRQALGFVLLSVLVGTAVHFSLVRRFVRGEFRDSFFTAAEYPGLRLITRQEAEDLWAAGQAVVIDARPERLYRDGRVPGARSVPAAGSKEKLPDVVLRIDRERTLVVYCEGGDCQSSLALARRLHDEGFRDIRVMTGGWDEWTKAGLPVEKGDGEE